MSATPPVKPSPTPSLPNATDGMSLSTIAVSLITGVFGILGFLHIGVPSGVSGIVQGLVLSVIAAVSQLVNVYTHRSAHKAAVVQGAKGLPVEEGA